MKKTLHQLQMSIAGMVSKSVNNNTSYMKKSLLLAIFVLLVSVNSVFATIYYYQSGTFTTAGNWYSTRTGTGGSAAANFAGASDIFILQGTGATTNGAGSGAANQSISTGSTWNVSGTLEIEGGATFTANNAMTIANIIIDGNATTYGTLATASSGIFTVSGSTTCKGVITLGNSSNTPNLGALTITNPSLRTISVSTTAKAFNCSSLSISSDATVSLTGGSGLTVSGATTLNGLLIGNNTSNTVTFATLNGTGSLFVTRAFAVTTVASSSFLQASGGTVKYTFLGSNLTFLSAYNNLIINDSTAGKTYTPAATVGTTVNGNLTIMSNTANIFRLASAGLTVNGNLTIGTNATYNSQGFASTIKGNIVHNGLTALGAGAITLGGSGTQTISGSGTFAALTLSNSGNISLSSDISVAGVLDMNSQILNVGANTLTLGTAATISNAGATAYFKVDGTTGKIIKQASAALSSFLIPTGIGSSYLPATITTGAATNVTVQPVNGAHSPVTSGAQIGEFWKITSSAATSVTPTFGFPDAITPASNVGSYYRSSAWTATATNPTGSGPYSIAFSSLTYTAAEVIDYTVERGCTPPTSLTVTGSAAICSGSSTNITLASAQSGVSYDLYKGGVLEASTTQTGTGADLTWSVSATGTYTVKSTTSGGYCASFMSGSAVITAKTDVGIGTITTSSSSICAEATQLLTANSVVGNNALVTWYSATGGTGTNYGTGTTLTTGPGTYFARVTGDCGTPVEATITVSATPAPSITAESLSAAAYTQGASTTALSVTATNATGYQWYKSSDAVVDVSDVTVGSNLSSYTPPSNTIGLFYYYCVVSGCNPSITSSVSGLIEIQAPASPTIATDQLGFSGTFGNQLISAPSSARTFVVSGSNLTGDILVSAPSGFEVSLSSGTGFGSSVNLTQTSGSVNNTTIYVRFAPVAITSYSGNISLTSTGATTVDIALTGAGIQPSVTPSSSADINFSVTGWTTSSNSSITLNGSNLLGDVTATVVAPFQVSLNGSTGWGTTVSFTNSGTLTAAPLYIRYNPSAGTSSNGTDASSLTIASTSLSNIVINLTGKAAPSLSPSTIATHYDVTGTAISNIVITINGGVSASNTSGLPTGVSGSLTGSTYTISGTPSVAGKYIYTLTVNGPTGTADATTTDTMYVADANKKIAFLYSGTVARGNNKVYNELVKYFKVDTILASNTASDTIGTSVYMTNLKNNYNLIVMHESVGSGTLTYPALGRIIGQIPILNNKVFMYGKANWPTGSGNNGLVNDTTIKIVNRYNSHPIFNGVTINVSDSNKATMAGPAGIIRYLTGATTTNQRVIAYNRSGTVGNISILEDSVPYTKKEKYMMIALSASTGQEDLTANGLKILSNACNYLMGKTIFATTSSNGTISPIGEALYEKNASQTYTFTPDAGYQIDSVYVDSVYNAAAVAAGFYTFSNLTANHIIRVTYRMIPCPAATINTQPSAVGESVCLNTSSTQLTVSVTGSGTVTYQWYSNTTASKIGGTLLTGATFNTYNPVTTSNDTLYYFCVITNTCPAGNFGKDTSNVSGSIKVHSVRGGTVSSNQTICPNTTPASLTLNGSVGTVTKWQSSTDNFVSNFTDIPVTTLTLNGATIGNLTATTYFRAELSDCGSTVNSSVVTVTVTNASAGTVSADQAVCSGTAPTALSVTGATGTIQWQSSSDNFVADSTNIGGATNASYAPAALTQVTYYRARVSTPCATEYSATITISINSLPSTPTGAVNDTRCGAGTVNLSVDNPGAGFAIDWYDASTGGSSVYTGLTYSPSIAANTTYYAAVRNTTTGCSSLPRLGVTGSLQTTTMSLTSNVSTTSQNVSAGSSITDITYSLGGTATTATAVWTGTASSSTAPDGVTLNVSASVVTVSGTPVIAGTYGYSLTTDGCTPANASGTITVKLATPVVGTASSITATGFTANWTGVLDAVSYTIKVYNGATLAATLNGATGVSAAVTGLTTATTYTYTVTAIGNGGSIPNSLPSSASASFTTLNTACSITAFTIAGQVSSSIGSNTITVTMPSGTNRFALSPSITLSSGATVSPNSGVAQDLRTSKVYTVTAQDGTTQKTYTVTVTNSPCLATMDVSNAIAADYGSSAVPHYADTVSGVGRLLKNATGSSTNPITAGTACAGSGASVVTTSSGLFVFQPYNAISKFTIYGSGTGTNRALTSLQVGSTTSNYATVTASATGAGDNMLTTSGVCDSITIVPSANIAANSYVQLTLTGNFLVNRVVFTLVGCVVPQLLTTPTISSSTVTNQGFTANWADVANEIGYTVKVYNASNAVVQTISNIPANSTSTVISGLSSNTNYTFTVTAIGDGDAYINSNESAKSSAIRTLSTLKDIATFTIAGVTATVGTNTVTATVPYSTNLASLTPVVTVSANATYSPLTAQDFSSDVVYTVTAEDGSTKDYTVTISKAAPSTATVISAYTITGQVSSSISGTNISVVMPYGTADVTALVPHFTLSTYATAIPDSAIATDFTNPVVYTITAEDGVTTQQYTVTVTNASQPSITPSSYSSLSFTTAGWTTSATQSITLNGANLSASIVATVAAPYQVSLNGSTNWGTSVSYTPTSGSVTAAALYIRYNPSSGTGVDNGTLTLSSLDATNVDITLNGISSPVISLTSGAIKTYVKSGVAMTSDVYNIAGSVTSVIVSGLPTGVTDNYSNGVLTISGTPTTTQYQAYPFTITVDGAIGATSASRIDTVVVFKNNIAFLYTTLTPPTGANKLYTSLLANAKYHINVIVASNTASDTAANTAYMTNVKSNDLILLHENVNSANLTARALGRLIGVKPILNTKAHMYGVANWPAGSGTNGANYDTTIKIIDGFNNHPIFAGVTINVSDSNKATLCGPAGIIRHAGGVTYGSGVEAIARNRANATSAIIENNNNTATDANKYLLIAMSAGQEDFNTNGLLLYNNACDYLLNSSVYLPVFAYTVSGTAMICAGSDTVVRLSNSQSGVTYQLFKDGIASGSTVTGTGTALTWRVSSAGVYTVQSVTTGNYIANTMTGSATISINPLAVVTPSVVISTLSTNVCASSRVTVTATPTNGGNAPTYNFKVNGTSIQNTLSNTFVTPALNDGDVVTVVMTANNTCQTANTATSNSLTFTYNVAGTSVWTGNVNTDFATTGNWCSNVVPTSGDLIINSVTSGNYPVFSGTASFNSLTLASGTTFGLGSGSLTLSTITGSGLLVGSSTSNLTLNSSSANTLNFRTTSVADTLIGSLTLNGSGKVTLGSGLGITTKLDLSNASSILDVNGHILTLKSSAAGTAEVAQVNGAIVDGAQAATKVTVERYIPKGKRNYRDLGPTVANAGSVFANWQEGGYGSASYNFGVFVTGKTGSPSYISTDATGFDLTTNGNTNPSLYSCVSGNWAAITTSTGGTKGINLDPFKGLRLLVRGARNFNMGTNPANMPTATTLRATGSLVTGTVTFNAIGSGGTTSTSYTSSYGLTPSSAYYAGEGWSFIANPYACPISWSSIINNAGTTGTNVGNFYCFLDPTYQNGGLQRYVTVQYNGSAFVTNRPAGIATDAACLNIQPGQGFWVYHTAATPKLVIQESDKVVGGTQTTVFRTAKSNMLNVSIWKDIEGVSISLDETVATFNNNYSKAIGTEDVKKLMNGAENIAIVEANTDLSINGIALPSVGDEIALSVGNVTANTAYQLKVDATQFDAPGVQAFIKDALLNTVVPAETVVNFTPTTEANTYKNRFSVVFKSAKVVSATTVKGSISIYPNPVTDKTFTLQTANVAAGKYNVVIVNSLGQEIFNTVINHKEAATTESVKLNQSVVGGLYTLVLRNADGKVVANTELLAK